MLGNVEPIVNQLGVGQVLRYGVGVGREHVGGDRSHVTALLRRQTVKDAFCSDFRAIRSDIHDSRSVDVREYGDVTLTLAEVFLVDAQVSDRPLIATLESACNGSCHDGVDGTPREPKQRCSSLDRTASLNHIDGQSLEKQREAGMLGGPRGNDCFHAMLRAAAPGQSSHEFRDELHRIEVPPTTFLSVIRNAADLATFRAGNTIPDRFEVDLDSTFFDGKGDVLNLPGIVEFQEASVVGS